MITNDELRALARAATPGPWQIGPKALDGSLAVRTLPGERVHAMTDMVARPTVPADAAYIAAASPDVVLRLLAEIDEARADTAKLRERGAEL